MKCECGNKIKILDIILPWRQSYALLITDDDGVIVEKERVCKRCFEYYQLMVILIGKMGKDEFFKKMEELEKVK